MPIMEKAGFNEGGFLNEDVLPADLLMLEIELKTAGIKSLMEVIENE